jgi:c-di-GMP phosphodiesterase
LLASGLPRHHSDLFLVGLLSLMDAILGVPMGMVLEGIALDRDTRAVLLGESSALSPIYELMLAQENALWDKVGQISSQLGLRDSFVAECHWKAMQWARRMTGGLHAGAPGTG